ncbi:MAG: EamA family transporter [Alphaproteobacteria bacterium]|nr:MAG: EamA family transporter [Alphaproteobacteria bacterium]
MQARQATLVGFGAVLLWSLLALLTVWTAPVPPFQLNAMAFAVAGVSGLVWTWLRGISVAEVLRRTSPAAWCIGVVGLFGYHALYFSALRLAPPAEAGLIAYLWPLLIVLFSGLLPGERLRAGHVVGALVAFAGAAIVVLGGASQGAAPAPAAGFALAFLCALTWSGYSVLSRLVSRTPTEAVTFFCLTAAALSGVTHMLVEPTRWPVGPVGHLAVLGLGLGPVGLAFFLWDVGVKRGDIRLLGVFSYAAPILSTAILVGAGEAHGGLRLVSAAFLVAGGAFVAARAGRR